uniref:Uncharacterized protein n=1 Tax=Setaria italica TaxID=4555 RepID=K4ANJ0_SETIT
MKLFIQPTYSLASSWLDQFTTRCREQSHSTPTKCFEFSL